MIGKKRPAEQQPKEKNLKWKFKLSPENKELVVKVLAVAIFFFGIFSLISSVSYIFTWQADQSLLTQASDIAEEVGNDGGSLGFIWGRFLMAQTFGLASFSLIALLFWGGWSLFFSLDVRRPVRKVFMIFAGTFLLSLLLTYCAELVSDDTFLEGGLGGYTGAAVVRWLKGLVGCIPTLLLILFCFLIWGIRMSDKVVQGLNKVSDQSNYGPFFRRMKEKFSCKPKERKLLEHQADESAVAVAAQDRGAGTDTETTEKADIDPTAGQDGMADMEPPFMEEPAVAADASAEEVSAAAGQPAEGVPGAEIPGEHQEMEIIQGESFNKEVTEELPRIDVRSDLDRYEFPSLDLLNDYADGYHEVSKEELESNNNKIRTTLLNYRIKIDKVTAIPGPTVTLYKIIPAPGVKIASIRNVEEDIAISLKARGVRVVKLEDAVGIEVANKVPSIVPLKAMLNDDSFRNSKAELPVAIGYTITQKVKTFDLADAPHLLIAGATKQGKSVGLNVIISSLLYKKHPSELKLVFIDPKMVEFSAYKALLHHYLAVLPTAANAEDEAENAIIKQPKQADLVLNSLCVEMDERYMLLSKGGVNNIKLYNEKYKDRRLNPNDGHRFLPYLVVVIDEYADLTMSGGPGGDAKAIARNVTNSIVRLAQKGRAAGIHVIIATQRPTVNVVTGLIKTNFPTRIAFRVVSRTDSSTILDANGAENLIGKGDMLYYAGVEMERVQCALVSMDEINKITKFIGGQTKWHQCYTTPYYLPMPETPEGESAPGSIDMSSVDPLFEDAAKMVVMNQKGSTSDLQRRLGIGYAKAGRIMDQLEAAGVVGPQEGSKPREVLVSTFDDLNELIAPFLK